MQNILSKEKLERYFAVTGDAMRKVEELNPKEIKENPEVSDIYDLITRYYADAEHFYNSDDYVNAFAALNYAHGLLDALARLKMIDVQGDNVLFIVDD